MTDKALDLATDLVIEFEGFRAAPYTDSVGVWTIGYGSTRDKAGNRVTSSTPHVTQEEAMEMVARDLAYSVSIVNRYVTVPLTDEQRAALYSFVYNEGPGKRGVKDGFVELKSGGPSTMLRKLNQGDFKAAAEQFDDWTYAGGVKSRGLVRRRAAERKMFESGVA